MLPQPPTATPLTLPPISHLLPQSHSLASPRLDLPHPSSSPARLHPAPPPPTASVSSWRRSPSPSRRLLPAPRPLRRHATQATRALLRSAPAAAAVEEAPCQEEEDEEGRPEEEEEEGNRPVK